MIRHFFRAAAVLMAISALPATAADKAIGVGSYDRIRIDGPFVVTVATGVSPRASIGGDRRVADLVDLHVEGDLLIVRMRSDGWGEQRRITPTAPVTIALATTDLTSVSVLGGASVTIGRMKAPRIDLSVAGPGTIDVAGAQGVNLNATVIGTGGIAIRGGYVNNARLSNNGTGRIDASGMDTGDLIVRMEGMGDVAAKARYTADVTSTGLGRVAIAGTPKCKVRAAAGGPVTCGVAR